MAVSKKLACKSVAEWREGGIDVTSRQTPIPDTVEEQKPKRCREAGAWNHRKPLVSSVLVISQVSFMY